MTPTLDRVTERVPVKEPAKAWRNKWRSLTGTWNDAVCPHCGEVGGHRGEAPDISWGCTIWPSREVAENFAQQTLDFNNGFDEYLGAFPVPA